MWASDKNLLGGKYVYEYLLCSKESDGWLEHKCFDRLSKLKKIRFLHALITILIINEREGYVF